MVTVGIIEDDSKLRLLLTETLRLNNATVLFEFSTVEEFTASKKSQQTPFLFFLDIGLPGISGIEAVRLIRNLCTETYLVIISGNTDEQIIWNAITAGANGYLIKPVKLENIRQHLQTIVDGGALMSPGVAQLLVNKIHASKLGTNKYMALLTAREKDVINFLMKGFTYKEVAAQLGLSVTTINEYIKNIYHKTSVHSKAELVSLFL